MNHSMSLVIIIQSMSDLDLKWQIHNVNRHWSDELKANVGALHTDSAMKSANCMWHQHVLKFTSTGFRTFPFRSTPSWLEPRDD
jgi:hypothetical protein